MDAVSYRRTLQLDGRGLHGLSTRQPTDAPSRWRLPPHGILTVSEPVVSLMSLPPVEEAFLVRVATLLTPLVFAPSELLPIGRMYVVHRGLALLRKRWLGVGAMWGLEMILQEEYTQQYAAAQAAAPMRPFSAAEGSSTHAPPSPNTSPPSLPTNTGTRRTRSPMSSASTSTRRRSSPRRRPSSTRPNACVDGRSCARCAPSCSQTCTRCARVRAGCSSRSL